MEGTGDVIVGGIMFGDVRKPNCSWVATRTPARACAPRTSPGALRRTHPHTHEARCNHFPPSRRAASYGDLPCVRRRCPSSRCGTPAATRGSGGRLLEAAPVRRPGLRVLLEVGGVLAPLLEPQLVGLAAATGKLRLRVLTPTGHQKQKILKKKDKVMVEVKLERNLDFVMIHNASQAGYGIGSDELGR